MTGRFVLLGALFLVALTAGAATQRQAPAPFPHEAHAKLFPNCTACHDGVQSGNRVRFYTVTASDCAACHNGVVRDSVFWSPPRAEAGITRFDHAQHGPSQDLECASCHGGGPERMAVIALTTEACLSCHGVNDHLAAENDCALCHVPLTENPRITAERLAGFPRPATHEAPDFPHVHGEQANAPNAQCAVCHARDLCETCHLNGDRLAAVDALPPDDRVHALVAGRDGAWPAPVSHQKPDWRSAWHGREALADPQSCANCHVQSSCDACHGRVPPPGRNQLPVAPAAGPQGITLDGAYPPEHHPGFAQSHGGLAASGSMDCMTCHTQTYCEDCHYGVAHPGYHPENYLTRHDVDARARDQNCADCHSQEVFCRSCHLEAGLASRDPKNASYHQGYGGYWVIAHGQAARLDMEDCASCHQQNDCLKCHSQSGWGVNPHGPGFDPGRLAEKSPQMCMTCHLTGP